MAEPTPLPPHPGSQPELFEFPFAEAKVAMAEIDATMAALRSGIDRHASAATTAMVGFDGRTADEFRAALTRQLDALDAHVGALDRAFGDLEDDIAEARRRSEASLDARALWSREMDDYEAAVAAGGP